MWRWRVPDLELAVHREKRTGRVDGFKNQNEWSITIHEREMGGDLWGKQCFEDCVISPLN